MIGILLKRVRQYKKYAFITPLFMIGEVAMEVLIPTLMALIIDNGVAYNDMDYIVRVHHACPCSDAFPIIWNAGGLERFQGILRIRIEYQGR